jgi:hypothetical protein
MSDSTGESSGDVPVPGPDSDAALEDDRRQKAAAVNRKKAEEQWLRNKERWIEENFPGKRRPS